MTVLAIELRGMLGAAIRKGERINRTKASKLATVADKRRLADTWVNREPRPGSFYKPKHAKPGPVTYG